MEVRFSKRFNKQLGKLSKQKQDKFWERLELWQRHPESPLLHQHRLSGKLSHFYSINIGGDLRALFQVVDGTIVIYEMIGTHSQLYG